MTLTLTSPEVIAAVRRLEGVTLPPRTLAAWAAKDIVVPSIAWPNKRGRYSPRVYSLQDLAKARLVVHLRRKGVTMATVRAAFLYLPELFDVLRPGTRARLVISRGRAWIEKPGHPALEVPSKQYRFNLADVVDGNAKAARAVQRAA